MQVGQTVWIKLVTYMFQHYKMLTGKVIHVNADATDANRTNTSASPTNGDGSDASTTAEILTYKARVRTDQQTLIDPQGNKLPLVSGMPVVAEINQSKRTVLEYLLSPVQKAVQKAVRTFIWDLAVRFNGNLNDA